MEIWETKSLTNFFLMLSDTTNRFKELKLFAINVLERDGATVSFGMFRRMVFKNELFLVVGFVAFQDPHDLLRALKEMDRKYVGNRPIRVMKSRWKERWVDGVRFGRIKLVTFFDQRDWIGSNQTFERKMYS